MNTEYDVIISLVGFIPMQHQAVVQQQMQDGNVAVLFYGINDITAVYNEISINKINLEKLEEIFADLTILTPYLYKHEEILEIIMRYSPVFPVQFGSFFSSSAALAAQAIKHHKLINRVLDEVDNQAEWSVKGYLEQTKATDKFFTTLLQERQEQLINVAPGLRYLKEQHVRSEIKNQLGFYLQPIYQTILEQISGFTTNFGERQIIPRDSVDNQELILNWAFLVNNDKIKEFNELIKHINDNYDDYGIHFSLTGPWPPYSFCRWDK